MTTPAILAVVLTVCALLTVTGVVVTRRVTWIVGATWPLVAVAFAWAWVAAMAPAVH